MGAQLSGRIFSADCHGAWSAFLWRGLQAISARGTVGMDRLRPARPFLLGGDRRLSLDSEQPPVPPGHGAAALSATAATRLLGAACGTKGARFPGGRPTATGTARSHTRRRTLAGRS